MQALPRIITIALVGVGLLAACGDATEGPVGPNGGTNRVVVTIDQHALDVDSVSLSAVSSTTTVELRFVGNVDPLKDAIDDEYGYLLAIRIDRTAYDALVAPASLALKGSTDFAGPPEGGPALTTWHPAAGGSEAIRLVYLQRSCFCADVGTGTQTVDGTLTLSRIQGQATVTGQLTLTVQGDILNEDGTHTVGFDVEFDLALQPAST